MDSLLGTAIVFTLFGWAVAEVVLQVRQFMRRGATERTERWSLLVVVVLVAAALGLAGPVRAATAGLSYSTHHVPLRAAVLVVAWAGIALRLWAIVTLGRFFRGTVHVQEDHQVVRSGPYRWMRHPSYSGTVLASFAVAVMVGNPLSWLLYAVCCLAAVGYRIRVEERMLSEVLGSAYTTYAAGTPRLIPKVW